MATTYGDIYEMFVPMITDYDLRQLAPDVRDILLYPLMVSACSQFVTCKKNLFDKDNELEQFNFNLTPKEVDIICHGMRVAWLSPKVLQGELFKSFLNTKDFYLSSPHLQLGQNRETEKEARKVFKQRD